MLRNDIFTLRLSRDERKVLSEVAKRLERSQSDTLRLIVREKARELGVVSNASGQTQPQPCAAVSG